ncbi:hypothetical protein M758_6G033400 [Ceratodon purpureus]|nr:hypothetical protein M758_6G033400 [Ceratodon purpureus]
MGFHILSLVALVFLLACKDANAFVCPKYIYSFGDSLTDTGNAHAEVPLLYDVTTYPYGMSYRFPDRPCERTRFCDGRLIVDYTAQAFGIPFLEPYSRRFEQSAYSHGVNFAYSGATARSLQLPAPTLFLAREVEHYFKFRAEFTGNVDVSTALHLIPEIGGNDYTYAFTAGLSPADANAKLDDEVLGALKQSVEKLHAGGARFFFTFNQPPAGCTPYYRTLFGEKSAKDEFGCLSAYNAVFETLNHKIKAAVEAYRQMWPDTIFLYYDWFAGAYEVIQNQAKYGIDAAGFRACCGGGGPYNFNPVVACGAPSLGNLCSDPERTLYWDSLHFTEAFYRLMATFALSGRFVDGPSEAVNLKAACNLDFGSFPLTIPNPPTCSGDKHL